MPRPPVPATEVRRTVSAPLYDRSASPPVPSVTFTLSPNVISPDMVDVLDRVIVAAASNPSVVKLPLN